MLKPRDYVGVDDVGMCGVRIFYDLTDGVGNGGMVSNIMAIIEVIDKAIRTFVLGKEDREETVL